MLAQTAIAAATVVHHHRLSHPVVRVKGKVLTWRPVGQIRRYRVLMMIDPSRAAVARRLTIRGTHFAPPPAPGRTVGYRVRADRSHARLSREVKITWPAVATVTRRRRPKPVPRAPTPPTAPTHAAPPTAPTHPAAPPIAPPAPGPPNKPGIPGGKLQVSVNNTTGYNLDSVFTKVGVTWTRLGVGDGSDLSLVREAVGNGIRPLVVYDPGTNGELNATSPATAAAQVKALAQQLLPLGLNEIEFGNEVYFGESATTYAAQYAAAHAAVAGMGVRLLAVATALAPGAAGYADPSWINDFVNALPGGAGEVDAWTIHPYGPMAGVNSNGFGWGSVVSWHRIAVAAGSNAPWYVTEVGQCLENCDDPVSEAQQASDMTQYLNDALYSYPWIAYINFYSSRDDPATNFGILNADNSPRPAFSALQTWMAAHAGQVDG